MDRDDNGRSRDVYKVEASTMANELKELKDMVRKMAMGQGQTPKKCEFCNAISHKTDECPTLLEEDQQEVNAMGGYQNFSQRQGPPKYGLAANGYSWRNEGGFAENPINLVKSHNHTAFHITKKGSTIISKTNFNRRATSIKPVLATQLPQAIRRYSKRLGDTGKSRLDGTLTEIGKQLSALATSVNELKDPKGKLPSQVVPNPKGNLSAMTLRNGKDIGDGTKEDEEEHIDEEAEQDQVPEIQNENITVNLSSENNIEVTNVPLPFPSQINKGKKKMNLDGELLELFGKVEITIPLIDAIKHVPKYAKFLKDLCTNKRGIGHEHINWKKNVSTILGHKVPQKCKDLGTFAISCIIGDAQIDNCMLDLGASINVLSYSLFRTLQIGPLRTTNLTIQLADRSCTKPEGVVIDVFVHVGKLVFLADFYVLRMEDEEASDTSRVLLGRPFMATARTKIDTYSGDLSMEADGEVINFNIYNRMKCPRESAEKPMLKLE